MKKLLSLVLTLVFCLGMNITAFASDTVLEVPELDLSLNLPEGTYVFTPETPDSDPSWKEAGLESAVEYKTIYTDMNVTLHLSANNGETNVFIAKTESAQTQSYFSYAFMTDEQLNELVEDYTYFDEYNSTKSEASIFEHEQTKFISLDMSAKMSDGEEIFEQTIFTIINGYTIAFDLYAHKPLSQESTEFLNNLVKTAKFGTVEEPHQATQAEIIKVFAFLALILLLIIAVIVFFVRMSVKAKKEKKANVELAEKISEYRKIHDSEGYDKGELMFENKTEITEKTISTYCYYRFFAKSPVKAVMPMISTLICAILSLCVGDLEWWLKLVCVLTFGYCVFRFFTMIPKAKQNLRKVQSKMRSNITHYKFYENEFLITGMQNSEFHPYFQITEFEEYKDYFYICFGINNCYYLNKQSFKYAKIDDFKAFIQEQRRKNL